MAPGKVEAPQTNASPAPNSGVMTPSAADGQWTPETVLSTLPYRPATGTTSPIAFFHLLTLLKTTKREGWRRFEINHGESISDHMYRMSLITLLCPEPLKSKLDLHRCTLMALVHDMAEALVGDITPVDGVTKEEKRRREGGTMAWIGKELLGAVGGGEAGRQLEEIWWEYENDETKEAHFVHDVDKVELLLQMVEYERVGDGKRDLGEFSRVASRIKMPEVKAWADEIMEERRTFWKQTGIVPSFAEDVEEGLKKKQDQYYDGEVEVEAKKAAKEG